MNLGLVGKFFGRRKAAKIVTEVVEKEVPKAIKTLKYPETIAFGFRKPIESDGFYKMLDDVSAQTKTIEKLKDGNAPAELIKHAEGSYPLKIDKKATLPDLQKSPKMQARIDKNIKDYKIKAFLKQQEAQALKKEQLITTFKNGHIPFKDTGIKNPDEVFSMIQSGKYNQLQNREMFEVLTKEGTDVHAEKLAEDIEELVNNLPDNNKLSMALTDRIGVVGTIGNETQTHNLAAKLTQELKINQNKEFSSAIMDGIGKIGKNKPEAKEFSNILLEQLSTKNKVAAYNNLANFNNQFETISQGALLNQESFGILVAAYKSAKTPEHKAILADAVLHNENLKDTAIKLSPNFTNRQQAKDYQVDILHQLLSPEEFSKLTNFQQGILKQLFSI